MERQFKSWGKVSLRCPTRSELLDGLVIIFFTWVTWAANNEGALGAVLASSTVGLLVGLVDKQRAVGVFTGTFAGMVSDSNLSHWMSILVLGLITAVLFRLFTLYNFASGVGGRLGFTAQLACTATLLLYFAAGAGHADAFYDPSQYAGFSAGLAAATVALTAAAAAATLWVRARRHRAPGGSDDVVTASALVGLAGAVAARAAAGPGRPWGADLALAAYCGSFVGMSGAARLPHAGAFLLAGAAAGALLAAARGVLVGGYGGKLGTLAFAGVLLVQPLVRRRRRRPGGRCCCRGRGGGGGAGPAGEERGKRKKESSDELDTGGAAPVPSPIIRDATPPPGLPLFRSQGVDGGSTWSIISEVLFTTPPVLSSGAVNKKVTHQSASQLRQSSHTQNPPSSSQKNANSDDDPIRQRQHLSSVGHLLDFSQEYEGEEDDEYAEFGYRYY